MLKNRDIARIENKFRPGAWVRLRGEAAMPVINESGNELGRREVPRRWFRPSGQFCDTTRQQLAAGCGQIRFGLLENVVYFAGRRWWIGVRNYNIVQCWQHWRAYNRKK